MAEPRLIDANALNERFDKRIKWLQLDIHDQYSLGLYHGAVTDKDLINEMPIVDAVEVVRCRECKFGVTPYGDEHDGWIECSNIHGRPLFGCNDFCSYGERKDSDWND